MSDPRATWGAMPPGGRIAAVAGLIIPVALVAAIATGVILVSAQRDPGNPGIGAGPFQEVVPSDVPLPPTQSPDPSATPSPTPSPTPPGNDPLLGSDGRLTVLLLGSDYRPAHPGNRTDAIMVISIDPTTGQAAGFSVPRDTVRFPLPGKGTYSAKINGLYQYLDSKGDPGKGMKAAVARAFAIEVDRYVFIGFAGVKQLVDAVGGVDVNLAKAYYDSHYWVTNKQQGWGLPAGRSHLNGANALIFARSRKGDNDFERARRQQLLVMAALTKVRSGGVDDLPKLLKIASRTVRTDMPLDRAADLYKLFSTVDLSTVDRVVFGPRRYADGVGGSSFALKLDVCRAWVKRHFPPVRPLGTWPTP
jgi:LCP family protein required for cell wall assembly